MPIPSTGPVLTPAGFQIVSAQGLVQLTWYVTPLATIYYVSRSTDNVTFSELGTTTTTSYTDTTGTVDTVYYYYIQAGNGTYSSLPTVSLAGLSLKPGETTCGNIILECQQRANKEYSQFYTPQELVSMVNQSYKRFFDKLVTAYGDDYYVQTPYNYTTGQNQQLYPLPADFYKLLLCEVALNPTDPNSFVTLKKFNLIQKNLWNYPNQYTMYGITNLRYRLSDNDLEIVPQTQGGQTIRITYVPRPNQLINLTDIVDGIAGWEEYIVNDVCVKMLIKEESFEQAQAFAMQLKDMDKVLDDMSKNRILAEPQTVSDIRIRNFAWGDSEGGFGGMGFN